MRKDKGIELEKFVLRVVGRMRYWCEWRTGFERLEESDELSYREMHCRNWRQRVLDEPSASSMGKGIVLVRIQASD